MRADPSAGNLCTSSQGLHVTYAPAIDSINVTRGWLVWSENHPPSGLPPVGALIRRGYHPGRAIFATGMYDDVLARWDSVVAVPFTRERK